MFATDVSFFFPSDDWILNQPLVCRMEAIIARSPTHPPSHSLTHSLFYSASGKSFSLYEKKKSFSLSLSTGGASLGERGSTHQMPADMCEAEPVGQCCCRILASCIFVFHLFVSTFLTLFFTCFLISLKLLSFSFISFCSFFIYTFILFSLAVVLLSAWGFIQYPAYQFALTGVFLHWSPCQASKVL